MHFITKKDSKTGKKFEVASKKIADAFKAQRSLAASLEIKSWRERLWVVCGGFSSIIFEKEPDKAIWKNVNGSKIEWMPRLTNKEGKAIQALFDNMPVLERSELNSCIGFDECILKQIGFSRTNKDYYGFVIEPDWDIKIPNDCKEVTHSDYNKLFKIKKKK